MNNIDIIFNEAGHVYDVTLPDGSFFENVPSVTTLEAIESETYNNVPGANLENAARRGTEIHALFEEYAKTRNKPDLEPLTFKSMQFANFEKMLQKTGLKFILAEQRLVYLDNGAPLFTGTCDFVGIANNNVILGDYKTTRDANIKDWQFQLSCYKLAIEQMFPAMKIEGVIVFHLPFNGKPKIHKIETLTEGETLARVRRAIATINENRGVLS